MGECEAVCNRIGILIKGEFRCIGSTEDLKAKSVVLLLIWNYFKINYASSFEDMVKKQRKFSFVLRAMYPLSIHQE